MATKFNILYIALAIMVFGWLRIREAQTRHTKQEGRADGFTCTTTSMQMPLMLMPFAADADAAISESANLNASTATTAAGTANTESPLALIGQQAKAKAAGGCSMRGSRRARRERAEGRHH